MKPTLYSVRKMERLLMLKQVVYTVLSVLNRVLIHHFQILTLCARYFKPTSICYQLVQHTFFMLETVCMNEE